MDTYINIGQYLTFSESSKGYCCRFPVTAVGLLLYSKRFYLQTLVPTHTAWYPSNDMQMNHSTTKVGCVSSSKFFFTLVSFWSVLANCVIDQKLFIMNMCYHSAKLMVLLFPSVQIIIGSAQSHVLWPLLYLTLSVLSQLQEASYKRKAIFRLGGPWYLVVVVSLV